MKSLPKISLGEQSISFQTIMFGVAQGVGLFRGFLSLFILSRLMSASDFGILGVIYPFSSLAASIILLGTTSSVRIVTPALPRPERETQFWGLIQTMILISGLSLLILWFFYEPIRASVLVPDVTREMFILALILIPLTVLELLFQSQITNNQEGKKFVHVSTLTALTDLGFSVSGGLLFGVRGVLYGVLISKTILVAWLALIIQRHDPFVLLTFRILMQLKKFFRFGLLIFLSGLSARLVDSSGRFAIARSWGSEAVGFFYLAYNLCSPINRIASPIYLALMPFLVISIAANDLEKTKHYLKTSFQLLLVTFCPLVLLLSLNAKEILQVVVTKNLSQGWAIIPFAAVGILFLQVGGVYNYNVMAHRKVHLVAFSTCTGAIVNIVLNIVLVPKFGIVAAAVSLMCSYALTVAIDYVFSQRITPIHLELKVWWKLVLSLSAMVLVLYGARMVTGGINSKLALMISGGLAGLAYAASALYLGLLHGQWWEKIRYSFRLLARKPDPNT